GATVFQARNPACQLCPLAGECVARRTGTPERYPVKTRKLKRGRREHALLWLLHRDRWWLVQRPPRGVWAGLWTLPEFESKDALAEAATGWAGQGRWLPVIEHALTHFDWTLHPLAWHWPARLNTLPDLPDLPAGRWATPEEALALGLPAPVRRLLEAAPG
ncbi:MAG TPA: NUDIX domain-containing protein, partial [Rubrivivax sp.]|nr:NUDIX domain-containing protein [Rubrivivax sp.]